jgi:cytosine/adenosine deaminase-related metal-dependent hydrolase
MLLTADWVLPVSRGPIRDGGVIVEDDRIVEVASAEGLLGHPLASEHRHFASCVLLPGLVNAHTHLSLTALEGLIEPSAFEDWLPRLVKALGTWDASDYAASARLGALRCVESGVTVVGDIVYGPEAPEAAEKYGLGGVFYWEVLGVTGAELYAELEREHFPKIGGRGACGPRLRCGISPHSPYTSGPTLLHAVHEAAMELRVPVAIHAAESTAETQLLHTGEGPLAGTAQRLAKGFEAPGVGAVAYLDRMGVLDGTTVIHLSQMQPSDVPRLAAASRGVVTCPRSNRYLGSDAPEIRRMLGAGIPVGVGTDSLASNTDLDLIAELRALQESDAQISPGKLIEMATAMGAIALGVEDRYGVLERGMQADIAAFRIPHTNDPESVLIETGGAATLEALMAGGAWRVKDGAALEDSAAVTSAAAASRDRAAEALRG